MFIGHLFFCTLGNKVFKCVVYMINLFQNSHFCMRFSTISTTTISTKPTFTVTTNNGVDVLILRGNVVVYLCQSKATTCFFFRLMCRWFIFRVYVIAYRLCLHTRVLCQSTSGYFFLLFVFNWFEVLFISHRAYWYLYTFMNCRSVFYVHYEEVCCV